VSISPALLCSEFLVVVDPVMLLGMQFRPMELDGVKKKRFIVSLGLVYYTTRCLDDDYKAESFVRLSLFHLIMEWNEDVVPDYAMPHSTLALCFVKYHTWDPSLYPWIGGTATISVH
jgi:hypothetical protein